jgi:hypothetical protein
MFRHKSLLVLAVVSVAACASDLVGPSGLAPSTATAEGLVVQLSVDREQVNAGEAFTFVYTIRNSGSLPVELESVCTALARAVVYRNSQEVGFAGSGSGCYNAMSTHRLEPGSTATSQWTIRAATILRAHPDGREPDLTPAAPGEYVVRAEPNVHRVNGVATQLPRLEHRLIVK